MDGPTAEWVQRALEGGVFGDAEWAEPASAGHPTCLNQREHVVKSWNVQRLAAAAASVSLDRISSFAQGAAAFPSPTPIAPPTFVSAETKTGEGGGVDGGGVNGGGGGGGGSAQALTYLTVSRRRREVSPPPLQLLPLPPPSSALPTWT